MLENKVPMIVLTGGPCAGKTTVLSYLRQKLEEMGYTVFTVPEMATLILNTGINPTSIGLSTKEFQQIILESQLDFEDMILDLSGQVQSKGKKQPLIICDRGAMDILAYMEPLEFKELAESLGAPMGELLGSRYQGVIHLRSAAVGLEEAYNLDNPMRHETAEEARTKDAAVCNAWCGHSHLRVVPAMADFAAKRQRVLEEVCAILGIPAPLEIERKYLVANFNLAQLPGFRKVEIVQHYLQSNEPNTEERIRKRVQAGVATYYRATKVLLRPGVRSEREHPISADEYKRLRALVDRKAKAILKDRYCFVDRDQYFELDLFRGEFEGLAMLEIELTSEGQEVEIPASIGILKEVTTDPRFSNRSLAYHGMPHD